MLITVIFFHKCIEAFIFIFPKTIMSIQIFFIWDKCNMCCQLKGRTHELGIDYLACQSSPSDAGCGLRVASRNPKLMLGNCYYHYVQRDLNSGYLNVPHLPFVVEPMPLGYEPFDSFQIYQHVYGCFFFLYSFWFSMHLPFCSVYILFTQ